MNNYLLYKLTYKFHRIGFYFYSIKFYYQDNVKNENWFKCFFKAVVKNFKIFNYKYGYYEYLEIPITTMCSLKCKHCSNLIPYYRKQKDYDIQILRREINAFLECINNIVFIRILGGEPFLSKNLYEILKILLNSKKIQRVEIVTNGTIIPKNKDLIKLLKNSKVIISISQYPMVNYQELETFLEKNKIIYRLDKMNFWMNYGDAKKRNRSKKELIRQYRKCNHICKSLVNGELHLCPRSSHGTDLKIIKDNFDDYLNILDKSLTVEEKKNMINKLLKKKYIKACDYCDFGTKLSKKIPVAEQITNEKKL